MFARQNLRTKGCIVLYRAIPDDVTEHLLSLSQTGENFWLPETSDGVFIDENRSRASVPASTSAALTADLQRFYKTFFPMSTAATWEFHKTTAGAADDLVRREFAPVAPGQNIVDECSVPGVILFAIEDNTLLYGYGWNNYVALQTHRNVIRLNRGDLIMFRGDFMYARATYAVSNVLVRGYLDTPLYNRPRTHFSEMVVLMNDTREIDDLFCFVWNCPFKGTGADSLRRHLNRYHGMFFNATRTSHYRLATDEA